MSEGMTTRSRALDDQFTTLNDRHDNLLSRLEAVCTTIQQHSDTFELVQKSLAAQQTVMADLMVKVSRLDRLPPPTPLLPSPPNPPYCLRRHHLPWSLPLSHLHYLILPPTPPFHTASQNWKFLSSRVQTLSHGSARSNISSHSMVFLKSKRSILPLFT